MFLWFCSSNHQRGKMMGGGGGDVVITISSKVNKIAPAIWTIKVENFPLWQRPLTSRRKSIAQGRANPNDSGGGGKAFHLTTFSLPECAGLK
jgi:hypothetical protein